jgi:hypothetical protein
MKSLVRFLGLWLLLAANGSFAQDIRTFTGGAPSPYNTNWERGDNWNTGSVPETTSTVYIPYGTPYVAVTGTECRAGWLTIQDGGRLVIRRSDNGKRLAIAHDLIIEDGGSLNTAGGTGGNGPVVSVVGNIENNGTCDLRGVSLANAGVVLSGRDSQTLRGTRAIAFANLSSDHTFVVDGVTVFVTGQFNAPSGLWPGEINGGRFLAGVSPYTITAESGPNGAVSPAGPTFVVPGESRNFSFTASPGYRVDSVFVDGAYAGSSTTYTFTAVAEDHSIRVVFVPGTHAVTSVAGGWNLVSLPCIPMDRSIDALLPGHVSGTAYGFNDANQQYVPATMLTPGEGCFVLFPGAGTLSMSGDIIQSIDKAVSGPGWVLLGGLSSPMSVDGIITVPPGSLVPGGIYGFDAVTQSYVTPTVFTPGKGYWVLANRPCMISMSATP